MAYQFLMDLHTHTIASVHAYSTVTENAREAKKNGLELMGMSDHGFGMSHTTLPEYWMNLRVIPDYLEGVRVLRGMEANICNADGRIFEEDALEGLQYLIASVHGNAYEHAPADEDDFTAAMVNALDRYPQINILGHPDDARYHLNYEEVISACKRNGVAVEVNNSSLNPFSYRQNSRENMQVYLKLCMKYEVPVIVNSDAHIATAVGAFRKAAEVLESVGFPEELLVNNSWEKLEDLLGAAL